MPLLCTLSRPADFDVIVAENWFEDILTDEASMLTDLWYDSICVARR